MRWIACTLLAILLAVPVMAGDRYWLLAYAPWTTEEAQALALDMEEFAIVTRACGGDSLGCADLGLPAGYGEITPDLWAELEASKNRVFAAYAVVLADEQAGGSGVLEQGARNIMTRHIERTSQQDFQHWSQHLNHYPAEGDDWWVIIEVDVDAGASAASRARVARFAEARCMAVMRKP